MHNLGGDRNANRFLNSMDEYLGKFRHELEYVYHLNKEGRDRINNGVIRKKTQNIRHFLLRNQLYIHLNCPQTWENEIKLTAGDVSITCDAMYKKNGTIPVIIEVDISQPMHENKMKIEKYKKIKAMTTQPFNLVWVTEIESRKEKLKELMEGLTGRVYTANEII